MNFVRNKKRISLLLVVISLLFLSTTEILAISKEECEVGDGEWKTIQIASPNEPPGEGVKSYCKCDIGFYWNTTSKKCEDDLEIRCIQTQGEWIDGNCQCPEGTIKWTLGFGCDKEGPIPLLLENKSSDQEEFDMQKVIYVFLALILLFILWKLILKWRKKVENK